MRIVAITFHVNLHPVRLNAWQSKLKGPLARYLRMRSFGDAGRIGMQFPRHPDFRDVLNTPSIIHRNLYKQRGEYT